MDSPFMINNTKKNIYENNNIQSIPEANYYTILSEWFIIYFSFFISTIPLYSNSFKLSLRASLNEIIISSLH